MFTKRLHFFALLGVLGGLGLSACGEKKEETNAPAGGGETNEVAVKAPDPAPPAEPLPAADLGDVAKVTGFAKYMPKSTHAYFGIYDGKAFVDGIRKSALVKMLEEQAQAAGGPDIEELKSNPEAQMILSLFAEEVFVGTGEGAPTQISNLVALNESTTRHWMKFLIKMGDMQITGEEPEGPATGMATMMMPWVGGLLGDPEAGIASLEKTQVPPVTIGFKVSDEDTRAQMFEMAAQGLDGLLQQIGPDGEDFAEAVNFERAGAKFTGLKLIGKKVAASIPEDAREGMAQFMDAATVEKLIKVLETKSVVIAVGVHDAYLVGFAGSDVEECQIAANPAESVLARPEAAFMKSYADKKVLAFGTMSREFQEGFSKNTTMLGSMALGVKDGLEETEGFGDTRDLEVLLDLVAKQERALFNMYTYKPVGTVAFLEEGLKVEAFGGSNMADLDLETPRKYASVGMGEDVFLFANWVQNRDYTEKALEYIDSIGETVYLGAKHVSKMELPEGGDIQEFKEGFGMFDEQIRPHLLELWIALRGDLAGGLGDEGAVIVDLKGEMPTVPGLPQVVVDEGKAPRLGLLAPVKDTEKLKSSWTRIDKAVQGLLKIASEMTGNEIPMQRPMTSEKNELKTWFFAFPFLSDDFVPNVSVDEENFFASTSKSFVQDLSAALGEAEVDESQTGLYFNVNLVLLNAYINEWIKLLDEHADEIFGEASPAAENFKQNLPMVKQVVTALGELKGISAHTRKEGGQIRTSIHVKTGE